MSGSVQWWPVDAAGVPTSAPVDLTPYVSGVTMTRETLPRVSDDDRQEQDEAVRRIAGVCTAIDVQRRHLALLVDQARPAAVLAAAATGLGPRELTERVAAVLCAADLESAVPSYETVRADLRLARRSQT